MANQTDRRLGLFMESLVNRVREKFCLPATDAAPARSLPARIKRQWTPADKAVCAGDRDRRGAHTGYGRDGRTGLVRVSRPIGEVGAFRPRCSWYRCALGDTTSRIDDEKTYWHAVC